jgi:Cu/Zn superoxide dismutase
MKVPHFLLSIVLLAASASAQRALTFTMHYIDGKKESPGKIELVATPSNVTLEFRLSGLEPGFHVLRAHEHPACSAEDLKNREESDGNPWGAAIIDNFPAPFANAAGGITYSVMAMNLSPEDMPTLAGSSLILFSGDDPTAEPGEGVRVACGFIKQE